MDFPFKLPVMLDKYKNSPYLLLGADAELIAELTSTTIDEARAIVYLINKGGQNITITTTITGG